MAKHRGFTFVSLLYFFLVAGFLIWIGFKVVPPYYDYFAVQKMLENLIQEYKDSSDGEIRGTFSKRLDVSFMANIKADEMIIERGIDNITLTVPIQRCSKMVHAVSLCVELEAKVSANK